MPQLNPAIANLTAYPSKAISQAARQHPDIVDLSIGEPAFGPPEFLHEQIARHDLGLPAFLSAVKSYQAARGSPSLRQAIADWYARRYQLKIDPEREILITHGGAEALALALLCATRPGQAVALTDPSYTLYQRSILTLGRQPLLFGRARAEREFEALAQRADFGRGLDQAAALIVNSPENPSGYVLEQREWERLFACAASHDCWLIHDEVYDSMAFARRHFPARCFDSGARRSILINSCSKKLGVPGLRIGWLVAHPDLIDLAGKAHDYLLLGLNRQHQHIAARWLADPALDPWLENIGAMLRQRQQAATRQLTAEKGFAWPRAPMGGMFLFPDVRRLYQRLAPARRPAHLSPGAAVAEFLFHQVGVATVPGEIYGAQGADHVRMVLCSSASDFDVALDRLTRAADVAEQA